MLNLSSLLRERYNHSSSRLPENLHIFSHKMGAKKSAAKDRGYVTATEWKLDGGGKKNASVNAPLKKLPFNCCALSFLPFETPVFDVNSGSIYDLENIFPYALKHKQDPITGRNMQIKDLKELKLKKSEGNKDFTYECPILGSEFTDSTKICVVKRSGYAYSYKAIEELVIKPKRWRDLMTDEKITRDDLLIVQDPMATTSNAREGGGDRNRMLEKMDHVITKKGANFIGSKGGVKKEGGSINADAMSEDVKRALDALKTKEAKEAFKGGGGGKVAEMEMKKANDARNNDDDEDIKVDLKKLHQYADKPHAADVVKFAPGAATFSSAEPVDYSKKGVSDRDYFLKRPLEEERQRFLNSMKRFLKPRRFEENHSRSDGKQAMGFTSTIGGEGLKGGKEKKPVFLNPKKGEKGYVSLDIQQFGSLNLELHCDIAPRTCENFLHLCEKGFYDGVKFHRNVPNFMIQGGDPTGTGKKGFSIYGETFKDEFGLQKGVLSHKERGIVSMANKGKDTNNSQFFITYGKNLTHLDGKHTIFGRVVGGLKVLDELEDIEADDKDPEKPGVDIIIEKTTVHQNPWTKLEKEYEDKRGGVADIKTANATMAVKTNTEKKMEEEEEKKKKMGHKIVGSGIGRFVTGSTANVNATKFMNSEEIEEEEEERRRKKAKATTTSAKRKGGFGNFESW